MGIYWDRLRCGDGAVALSVGLGGILVALKAFLNYGDFEEVVIPLKRDKLGKRFGFARAVNVSDPDRFGLELDNMIIGRDKIYVNLSRFSRIPSAGPIHINHKPKPPTPVASLQTKTAWIYPKPPSFYSKPAFQKPPSTLFKPDKLNPTLRIPNQGHTDTVPLINNNNRTSSISAFGLE